MCCRRRKKKLTRDTMFDERSNVFPLPYQHHHPPPQQVLAAQAAAAASKKGAKDAGGRGRRAKNREKSRESGRNGCNYRNSYERGYHREKRNRRDDDTLRNIPHKMPEYDAEDEPNFFEQKCQEILRQQLESLQGESEKDKDSEGLMTPGPPTVVNASQKTSKQEKSNGKVAAQKSEAAPRTALAQEESKSCHRAALVTAVTKPSQHAQKSLARTSAADVAMKSTASKKEPSGSAPNSRQSETENMMEETRKSTATAKRKKKSETIKKDEKKPQKSKT